VRCRTCSLTHSNERAARILAGGAALASAIFCASAVAAEASQATRKETTGDTWGSRMSFLSKLLGPRPSQESRSSGQRRSPGHVVWLKINAVEFGMPRSFKGLAASYQDKRPRHFMVGAQVNGEAFEHPTPGWAAYAQARPTPGIAPFLHIGEDSPVPRGVFTVSGADAFNVTFTLLAKSFVVQEYCAEGPVIVRNDQLPYSASVVVMTPEDWRQRDIAAKIERQRRENIRLSPYIGFSPELVGTIHYELSSDPN